MKFEAEIARQRKVFNSSEKGKQLMIQNGDQAKYDNTYPPHFPLLCEHDNDGGVVLPNHPPEVLDRVG